MNAPNLYEGDKILMLYTNTLKRECSLKLLSRERTKLENKTSHYYWIELSSLAIPENIFK
jgi:hypothetical protein